MKAGCTPYGGTRVQIIVALSFFLFHVVAMDQRTMPAVRPDGEAAALQQNETSQVVAMDQQTPTMSAALAQNETSQMVAMDQRTPTMSEVQADGEVAAPEQNEASGTISGKRLMRTEASGAVTTIKEGVYSQMRLVDLASLHLRGNRAEVDFKFLHSFTDPGDILTCTYAPWSEWGVCSSACTQVPTIYTAGLAGVPVPGTIPATRVSLGLFASYWLLGSSPTSLSGVNTYISTKVPPTVTQSEARLEHIVSTGKLNVSLADPVPPFQVGIQTNFYAWWQGYVIVNRPGAYSVSLLSRDSAALIATQGGATMSLVNSNPAQFDINTPNPLPSNVVVTNGTGTITVVGGQVNLDIRMFKGSGPFTAMVLQYSGPDTNYQMVTIPEGVLRNNATGHNPACIWARNQVCSFGMCMYDCQWQDWANTGGCSASCGGGLQNMVRVTNGPFFAGRNCLGSNLKEVACSVQGCPCATNDCR